MIFGSPLVNVELDLRGCCVGKRRKRKEGERKTEMSHTKQLPAERRDALCCMKSSRYRPATCRITDDPSSHQNNRSTDSFPSTICAVSYSDPPTWRSSAYTELCVTRGNAIKAQRAGWRTFPRAKVWNILTSLTIRCLMIKCFWIWVSTFVSSWCHMKWLCMCVCC